MDPDASAGGEDAAGTQLRQPHPPAGPSPSLVSRYFSRLGIDDSSALGEELGAGAGATLDKLKILHERHLDRFPFENLSQHGLGLPAALDAETTASKILDRRRGGFCFELNGLFARLLEELGYRVVLVPAQLYRITHFDAPTHLVLVVTCHDGTVAFADVGFGEPPIHPLLYDVTGNLEQVTPEGMRSKLVRHHEDDQGDAVFLYWFKNGEWVPRLRWSYPASLEHDDPSATSSTRGSTTMRLQDFHPYLETVHRPESNFSKKLICCRLTRDRKVSLAGSRLKITGPPRFPEDRAPVTVRDLDSVGAVRRALSEHFDIALEESSGLDLSRSLATDPVIWSQL
jgi:N-hydroxyarylamine O-acetyltransferase